MFFLIMISILSFPKETFAEENDCMTITYSNNISSGFLYSDDMMLVNANELSPDIAKMAMGLANAAYKESEIKRCFSNMGYSLLGGDTYNYTKNTYTYTNNDYVDYSIGYKVYKGYNIYLVVIKGTGTNYDWFSNFNLGVGNYHQGFKLAADGVLSTINSKVNTTNNIFLVTGHSRGAAVANIIAAELTMKGNLASSNHILGYTYACPAVKIGADTSYSNIRNYNNPGDAIPELPLKSWGYERYGITINLSTQSDIYQNFEQRFKSVETKTYAGILNTDSFVSAMQIIANDRSAFYSKENHLLFDIAAYLLGPISNKNIGFRTDEFAVILKNNDVSGSLKKALTNIISSTISGGLTAAVNAQHQVDTDFLVLIDAGLDDTMNASEDEVVNWIASHLSLCDKIQNDLGITVDSRSKLVSARSELISKMNEISYVSSNLESVYYLYFSTNGNINDAIAHAHQPSTYVLWINSMYYGYEGWRGNPGNTVVDWNVTTNIGDYCFSYCENIEELSFPESITTVKSTWFANCVGLKNIIFPDRELELQRGAFSGCSGLTEIVIPSTKIKLNEAFLNCDNIIRVTIPVDHNTPYFGCSRVKEIVYTAGETGEMPNIGREGSNTCRDASRIEYTSKKTLKKVVFEEGVKSIGAFAYYWTTYSWWSGSTIEYANLEEVILPESLESIGEDAFRKQISLKNIKIPDRVKTIGEYCFAECTGFTSTKNVKISENMSVIPKGFFYQCTGITEISLSDTIEKVEEYAFSGCTGITEISLPDTIEKVEEYAFSGCTGITEINLIDRELELQRGAFSDCSGLTEIVIPSTKIKLNEAFLNCDNIIRVTIPVDHNTPYFGCSRVKEIVYTAGETGEMPNIGREGSNTCRDASRIEYTSKKTLKKVVFEEGVKSIGAFAYYWTTYSWWSGSTIEYANLEEVILPESLESIGEDAFRKQVSLKNIKIPDRVKTIEEYCFAECAELTLWSLKGSSTEKYANSKNITFKAINYPYMECNVEKIKPGKTYPFSATVYTNINETTKDVIWSVQGSKSEKTTIDEFGFLTVADDESAKILSVSATYGKETASVNLSMNNALIATFIGDISTTIAADEENHIARPFDLEEEGYQYSYYLDKQSILDDEWPLTIDNNVTINVVKEKLYYHITYHLNGGENAADNPERYPVANPYIGLSDPRKEHYEFLGWYLDENFETQVTQETALSGDIDVFAKWQGELYTITFDVNGGNALENSSKDVRYGEELGTFDEATWDNHIFLGWFTSIDGDIQITTTTICEGNLTVYAHWSESSDEHEHSYEYYIVTNPTCTENGMGRYTCAECGDSYDEIIEALGHGETEIRNEVDATTEKEGYTGDTYCKVCNTLLEKGTVIERLPEEHTHEYQSTITRQATCLETGVITYSCRCGDVYTEEIPSTGHQNIEIKNVKNESCNFDGYSGDRYCSDCGTLIEEGKIIPKTDHVWNKGEIITPATCTTEGIKTYTCTFCGTTKTEAIAATGHGATEIKNKKDASVTSEGYTGDTYCTICNQKISSGNTIAKLTPQTATPGKTIKDKSTNGVYKVLKDGVSVEFTKPVYRKASVRIPDTIKVNGITCKVTGISANAFKNNKSLKSVTIGRNVTVIGTNAFYGCKKLNKVSGGNGIVKIGYRAFVNCSSLSKITILGSVRSIGKQAFFNCKKLRSITIKTSTLSGKTVGSKAFAGTYKKPTVKVPAKQMKAYKKLLKARGMSSKAVYRK